MTFIEIYKSFLTTCVATYEQMNKKLLNEPIFLFQIKICSYTAQKFSLFL